MLRFLLPAFVLLALLAGPVAAANKAAPNEPKTRTIQLDEATLSRVGNEFTKAVADKNIAALGADLADDIDITIEIMGQEQHLTKAEYLANFRRSWDKIKDYEFKPTSGEVEVSIDSPTRATYRFSAIETMLFNDIVIKGLNEQENVVELRNGRPLMTKANVHISVYASVKI